MDKLAKNYSNVMEKILQAFSDIADVLPRLDRLKATFPDDNNFNQVVGLIYSDVIEFHRRAYRMFRRRGWHFWFAFDWGLFERRFKLILQKLASHCDLLDKEAAAAHFSEMKQFRDKRQLEEDAFERQRHIQMAQDVFIWLSATEDQQQEHLHLMSDKRQPETCDWILRDPQMQPWMEDDSGDALLWMTAIPGAGKSIICSLIIEILQSQQRFSCLYYFCSCRSSSANTSASILRTLAYQLLQQNLDMASLIHQAYLQTGSNRSAPAMKKLLTQILPDCKNSRIVIDGVDENDHAVQQDVLRNLFDIQRDAGHCCKLLVSSRDEPQIRKSLAPKTLLRLGDKTNEGLNLYIKDRINGLQIENPWLDSALISLAEQRLQNKAKGMFLWVRLVTEMLGYQTSEQEFRANIDQLPEGLDKAYGSIQSRINSLPPFPRRRAFTILYWVCVARRPISLHEVVDGIALHSSQKTLDRSTRSNNPDRDIIELCAPLLERLKGGVLDLVHFSAKEYFLHEQSGPFIDLAEAHLNIAMSSVINLTACLDFVPQYTGSISSKDLESRIVQGCYGLHAYGQEFWAEHVLAYLGKVKNWDAISKELIITLVAFSQVWKHNTNTGTPLASSNHTAEVSLGLANLQNSPALHRFILGWLHFRSEFNKTLPGLSTLRAQEDWKLRTDETFLSLIDSSLSTKIERLLMMQSDQLPSHIDEKDFKQFVSRFKFLCRFQGCNHQFDAAQDRDSHEESHILSFPCLQCDFSGRGFRSRRELEKHTQKYHMSPEDFEIPDGLHAVTRSSKSSPGERSEAFRMPSSRPVRWTERGRQALQQGFSKVVTRLESELVTAVGSEREPGSENVTSAAEARSQPSQHPDQESLVKSLDSIRHKIEAQGYESLTDFKNGLSTLSGNQVPSSALGMDSRIESICEDEFEKTMSAFPDFANFDHIGSREKETKAPLSDSANQIQRSENRLRVQRADMAISSAFSFDTRVPYWSLPEQIRFPGLIERYGRGFEEIANHLKTKTPEEVEKQFWHLVDSGDTSLQYVADLAEARIQRGLPGAEAAALSQDAELKTQAPDDSYLLLESSQASPTPYPTQFANTNPPMALFQGPSQPVRRSLASGEHIEGPIRKKRRPPPRAFCPYCTDHKEGLRDEYALKKHVERFHTPTRKVWICEDISIDKKFLSKCEPCSAIKRYRSKGSASQHLRDKHFNLETSSETLQRWIQEIEEPNPNIRTASTNLEQAARPARERHVKRGRTFSLPPLKNHPESARLLPSTIFQTDRDNLSDQASGSVKWTSVNDTVNEDQDTNAKYASISSSEDESFENEILLEGVSFENFLPGNSNRSVEPNHVKGPPHRTNCALIKPDQVSRLPNLSSHRQTACLDQVEALYHKLDKYPELHTVYKEALDSLTSLSRFLMKDLRDWRRHATLAPPMPFSI